MKVLIIKQEEIHQLLPIGECIAAMEDALSALANARALNPLRQVLHLPDRQGVMGIMPAYVETLNSFGLKVVSVFHNNKEAGHDSHQGAVLLFEAKHGCLQAIVDASAITAIRTAAVSGVATKLLARENSVELAVLGSGVQAHTHVNAMLAVRRIEHVRVWSPNSDHLEIFAKKISHRTKIKVTPATDAFSAVKGADIICTTTSAREPVLMGDWLGPGVHINAVGSSIPTTRELDSAAVAKSRLFVDRRESAINEAGDYLMPHGEGKISAQHIQGEIGEVLTGQVAGRCTNDEITLFKSLGLAVEDVASAHLVYEKALRSGAGTWVEIGGKRQLSL